MVCWDVGANVGLYTLLFAELAGTRGRVFAFEPVRRNVYLLRQHVEMNSCQNVRIVPCALSNFDGEVGFDLGPNTSTGHVSTNWPLKVPCSRADTLLASVQVEAPDIMKIDVEGAEADVLRGARNAMWKRPIIFLATHGAATHRACLELLAASDYEIRALNGGTPEGTDEVVALPRARRAEDAAV
jgi:FkbM family methyltransferase